MTLTINGRAKAMSLSSYPKDERTSNDRFVKQGRVKSCLKVLIPVVAFNYWYNSRTDLSILGLRSLQKEAVHPGYELASKEFISELQAECLTYRHLKTGAEILSVHGKNGGHEDKESTFGIFFGTPPTDSTGTPHILEHSVLCGSDKFKTKEPFANLLKGSLNTFLNAFTWPDKTGYAFSSCNKKDFYNSLDVYLDAVFHPRAVHDKYVLAQEGWHLGPASDAAEEKVPTSVDVSRNLEGAQVSKDTPLSYSGVVFSEMKGVYSSPDGVAQSYIQQSIFPDNTYRHDSGGDPAVIPSLTFEKFVEFYHKHYHPTNAKVFVNGLADDNEFLTVLDGYLKDYDRDDQKKVHSQVKYQKKNFSAPKQVTYPYSASNGEEGHIVSTTWLLNDSPLSPMQECALVALDHILTGTSESVLNRKLRESQLGTALTGGGLETELLQATFGVGLKGVKQANVKVVESLILDTLSSVAQNGFSDNEIAATMNTIEFNLREFNSGDPKGISLMFASISKWMYDYGPINNSATTGLKFEDALNELKESISKSKSAVFQKLLNDLFLNNNHRVTLDLYPSTTIEAEKLQKEQQAIEQYKASLTESELNSVVKFAAELKRQQAAPDSPEAVATIPTITPNDIDPKTRDDYPISVEHNAFNSGVTAIKHELQSTVGIVYTSFGVDISGLALSDVEFFLPLFTGMMTKTGTKNLSDVALSQQIGMHTGGVSVSTLVSPVRKEGTTDNVVHDGTHFITKLMIEGKATAEKADKLFSIIRLILTESNLNSKDKANEMMKSRCSNLEDSISSEGSSFALTRLRSRYSVAGIFSERMNGVTSLQNCKALLKQVQNDWESVHSRLETIRKTILDESSCRSGMVINLTGDSKVLTAVNPHLRNFLNSLPGKADGVSLPNFRVTEHPWALEAQQDLATAKTVREALIVPTQVSYVGEGNKIYNAGETVSGSSSVVSSYLSRDYLWDNIRVQGGAYGAYGILDSTAGFYGLVSYRDPNLDRTLKAYDSVPDVLKKYEEELKKDRKPLDLAIISEIGSLDGSPPSPSQKGWISFMQYLTGSSRESRQKWRDGVLATKPADFGQLARKLQDSGDFSLSVVCSQPAYDEAVGQGQKLDRVPFN